MWLTQHFSPGSQASLESLKEANWGPSCEPTCPGWDSIPEPCSGYPELSGSCHKEKLVYIVLSPWACLIFSVHAVEGVVKEVVEHAKEAGEKGMLGLGKE